MSSVDFTEGLVLGIGPRPFGVETGRFYWVLVGAVGIEPTTFGLKGRCSTTELRPFSTTYGSVDADVSVFVSVSWCICACRSASISFAKYPCKPSQEPRLSPNCEQRPFGRVESQTHVPLVRPLTSFHGDQLAEPGRHTQSVPVLAGFDNPAAIRSSEDEVILHCAFR